MMLETFLEGIQTTLSAHALLAIGLGTVIGYVFGFMPGMQSTTALVLLLPFTFGWDPMTGMYVFAGVIGAAGRGGSIAAIALNMPGTVVNMCTALDGYPLAQRGRAGWALGIAASTSLLGALFGLIVLVLVVPVFLPFAMLFGPAELFWIMVFGIVCMSVALPGKTLLALISVGLGIVLATVGFGGPATVAPRFTFGSIYLMDGLHLVVVIIGLLVVSEAIANLSGALRANPSVPNLGHGLTVGSLLDRWREGIVGLWVPFRYPGTVLRSSAIGTLIGAIPGVGGSVAQFFSYNAAFALSRRKEEFGRGSVEGLIAAETAVDSKEGGTLLPTLVFAIPGNVEMALVLAAWELHGLQPGVFFLQNHAQVAWALILGLVIANLFATVLQILFLPLTSRIPTLRVDIVAVSVMILAGIAAFSIRQNLWDLVLIVVFGLIGVVLRANGFSIIGIIIGFILGGMMEANFHRALQSSLGDYSVFVSTAMSVGLLLATVAVIFLAIGGVVQRLRRGPASRRA